MDPPPWLSVQKFTFGVCSRLPSLQATQWGGFTVVEPNLIPSLPMIPVRPSHWQCGNSKYYEQVFQDKRLFSCDNKLSLLFSVMHMSNFSVFIASDKARSTGSAVWRWYPVDIRYPFFKIRADPPQVMVQVLSRSWSSWIKTCGINRRYLRYGRNYPLHSRMDNPPASFMTSYHTQPFWVATRSPVMPSMVIGLSNLVIDPETKFVKWGVTTLEHPVSKIISK